VRISSLRRAVRVADPRATQQADPRAMRFIGRIARISHPDKHHAASIFPRSQCYLGVRP
jgi:hypothetical protein